MKLLKTFGAAVTYILLTWLLLSGTAARNIIEYATGTVVPRRD